MRAQCITGLVYTDYHPRWLRQHVSTYWWLEKPSYFAFILRESTLPLRRLVCVYLLLLINAVVDGPAAYEQFMAWSAAPWMILAECRQLRADRVPRHHVLRRRAAGAGRPPRRTRVPGQLVLIGHYAAWVGASAAVIWLLVRA